MQAAEAGIFDLHAVNLCQIYRDEMTYFGVTIAI